MKKILLYFVSIVLLVIMVSMSGVGQVLGQQKETPTEPVFYWTPDPNNPCPSCVQLICDENNVWCSTVTPVPPVPYPYPDPDMIYIVETVIEPYPAPVSQSDNNDDDREFVYMPVVIPTPIPMPTVTYDECAWMGGQYLICWR